MFSWSICYFWRCTLFFTPYFCLDHHHHPHCTGWFLCSKYSKFWQGYLHVSVLLHQNLRCKLVYETSECQDVTISFALDEIIFLNYFFCTRNRVVVFCPLHLFFKCIFHDLPLCRLLSSLVIFMLYSSWHAARRRHPFVCLQQLIKKHKNLFWSYPPIPIKQCCRFLQQPSMVRR